MASMLAAAIAPSFIRAENLSPIWVPKVITPLVDVLVYSGESIQVYGPGDFDLIRTGPGLYRVQLKSQRHRGSVIMATARDGSAVYIG